MKKIKDFKAFEMMVHDNTLRQMKEVSDILDGIDIGKRVSDDSFANAQEGTKRDIIQTYVQTYQEYMDEPFDDNQNRAPWETRKNKSR